MKVLLTRPLAQVDDFADKLRLAGFEPVIFPVIEIRAVEDNSALGKALEKIACYDWVIFTSANAVDAFWGHLPSSYAKTASMNTHLRFAAVGPKTAAVLRKYGIEPDFVPAEYIGEAILPGLGDVNERWFLLPRAEIARQELPRAISKAGGIVHEIIVYRTLPAEINAEGLKLLKKGVDIITFTSPSTVENFVEITRRCGLDPLNLPHHPRIACIGPITEQAAREAGFQNILTAQEYTTDGLLTAITKWRDHDIP